MKNEEKSVSYSFWQITKKSKKMETQKISLKFNQTILTQP